MQRLSAPRRVFFYIGFPWREHAVELWRTPAAKTQPIFNDMSAPQQGFNSTSFAPIARAIGADDGETGGMAFVVKGCGIYIAVKSGGVIAAVVQNAGGVIAAGVHLSSTACSCTRKQL